MFATLNHASDIVEPSKEDPRVKQVLKTITLNRRQPDTLIAVLHTVQDSYGYLPLGLLKFIAREMRLPPSRIYGVATFYHYFNLKPRSEHTCVVCTGTACYVKGSQKLLDGLQAAFRIKSGENTPDKKLGIQTARCLGACGLAPVAVIDDDIVSKAGADGLVASVRARIGG